MALNERAEHIYELASIWLNECLFNDGSLFWPDRNAWTRENLDSFWSAFAENLDTGAGTFVEKWAQQLSGQSEDVHRMAVDLTAIYCLFPRDQQMGRRSKLKLMNDVLAFCGDLGEMDQSRWGLFSQAIEGGGVGLTGAGYLAARPFHMGMYLGFAKTVKESGATSIDELQPKAVLDDAFKYVAETMKYRPVSTKHILLHILWPERFEDYASADYKMRMAKNLSAHFGLTELADIDETILQARKYMEANGFEPNFSMHADHIEPIWDPETPREPERTIAEVQPKYGDSSSHIIVDRAPVYEIAQLFQTRVIDQRNSLLWPNESLWTDDAIEEFLIGFRDMPVEKGQTWLQVYEAQFAQESPDSARILADSYAFLMLFPSVDTLSATTKANTLRTITSWAPESSPDQATMDNVIEGFGLGVGSPGRYFSNNIQYQLAFVPAFVRQYRNNPDVSLPATVINTAQELKAEYSFSRSVIPARNIVLHLLDPANFERIASHTDKTQIIESFVALIDDLEVDIEEDLDRQLSAIRTHLAGEFFPQDFDFYDENVAPYWNSDSPPPWPPSSGSQLVDGKTEQAPAPTIADLAAATFLEEPFLRDIESLLTHKQQLIFEGPPGSGKTFVAEKFARYFTGTELNDSDPAEQIELVQFHQSYTYEDFVEGIRPRTNDDGQLVYEVVPGIFRTFADKAHANPDKKFVLIIDEINRGNVSRILGELMLLLEYRDKSARLPYSQDHLRIPENLFIIGTMNTADRSLSQIDYALRRRFYFVRFLAVEHGEAPVLSGWLRQQDIESETRARILHMFIELNRRLRDHLETDDLQVGHSYFMDARIHDEGYRQQVWKYAVIPLIREYLYHHRERDELLQEYELQTLSTIVQPIADDLNEPLDSLLAEDSGGEYE